MVKIVTLKNAIWPLLLALLTVVSYLVISTTTPLNQRIPAVWLVLLVIAVVWSVALLRAKTSILRAVALAATIGLAALFSWWTLSFSEYESQAAAVADGDVVAELATMSLRDHAGLQRPVLAEGGPTLLVLYRGHW